MSNETKSIQLIEYQEKLLSKSELTEKDACSIYSQFNKKLAIDWPSPKTNDQWCLITLGWVGFIPLSDCYGIYLQPKVSIQNLFRMLEYAYELKSFKLLDGLYECESVCDIYERLVVILAERLLSRARNGLYKTFKDDFDECTFIRGRIDIPALSRKIVKTNIPCSFEDHTIDVEDNQIIAWTLHTALLYGLPTIRSISILRRAEKVLRNSVSLRPFSSVDCICRNYNRLNYDYEVLHKLCRFILEFTGPTQNYGDRSMVPFLVDMAHLFELFVARWLELNLDKKFVLKRQEAFSIGTHNPLQMQLDLIIYDAETRVPLCVIDTKYKSADSIKNDDYYQVVAYADAISCPSAILIYPRELKCTFDQKPGNVRVATAVFNIGIDLEEAGRKMLQRIYEVIGSFKGVEIKEPCLETV